MVIGMKKIKEMIVELVLLEKAFFGLIITKILQASFYFAF